MNPIDTLSFRPLSLHSQSADPNNQHSTDDSSSIRDLFKKIHIYVQEGSIIEFTELFDARNSIKTKTEKAPASKEDPTKEEARYLTYAARLGLRLPARGVLDLWQLAHRVVNDPKIERKRRAAKLARTMLRNFIAESAMSSKAGRCLQERIIRRTATDRTILDFYEPNPTLNVSRLYSPDFELRVNLAQGLEGRNTRKTNVRSWLSICRPYAAVLSLKKRSQHPIRGDADCNDSDCNSALLPDLVAAWLIILYDILIWAPKMAVIAPPRLETAPLIKTSYEVVQVDGQRLIRNERASLWWPAPRWEISLAHDVFQQLWEQFLDSLETLSVLGLTSDFLVRLLAMGWISCALDTFRTPLRVPDPEELADAKSSRDVEKSDVNIRSRNSERKWIMATVIEKLRQSEKWTNKDMEDTEKNTLEAAAGLYSEILKYSGEVLQIGSKSDPRDRPQFFSPHNGLISMRNWLEQELPLLLSNFYVPVTTTGGEAHSRIKIDFIKDTELAKSWSNNSMFILAKLEKELSDVFSVTPENPELPAYFKDLHQYWADIGSGTT